MTNQKESRPDKWTELFSLLELSVEEQKAAEAYLDGKEGIQVLEGISFRDISGTDPEPVKKMFDELIRKKRKGWFTAGERGYGKAVPSTVCKGEDYLP